MNKDKNFRFSGFGFSTILLAFVMICVVTFAALSAVTSHSDYKLSRQIADRTAAYYEAQARAHETLYALEDILLESYQATKTGGSTAYYAHLEKSLQPYGIVAAADAKMTLSFQEPIADGQQLCITLRLHYPQKADDPFYEIIEWKSVYE